MEHDMRGKRRRDGRKEHKTMYGYRRRLHGESGGQVQESLAARRIRDETALTRLGRASVVGIARGMQQSSAAERVAEKAVREGDGYDGLALSWC